MLRLLSAVLLLAVAGCGLFPQCESSFPDQVAEVSQALVVDGAGVGDTLVVAIVEAPFVSGLPELRVYEASDLTPALASSEVVGLEVEVEQNVFEATPRPPLVAAARGDTVYVSIEGTFDLVVEACPASEGPFYVARVVSVEAPAGVRAVRVTRVDGRDLDAAAVAALHDAASERRAVQFAGASRARRSRDRSVSARPFARIA